MHIEMEDNPQKTKQKYVKNGAIMHVTASGRGQNKINVWRS
jgi:hypothetical protein